VKVTSNRAASSVPGQPDSKGDSQSRTRPHRGRRVGLQTDVNCHEVLPSYRAGLATLWWLCFCAVNCPHLSTKSFPGKRLWQFEFGFDLSNYISPPHYSSPAKLEPRGAVAAPNLQAASGRAAIPIRCQIVKDLRHATHPWRFCAIAAENCRPSAAEKVARRGT
jgi:hypothetical protein